MQSLQERQRQIKKAASNEPSSKTRPKLIKGNRNNNFDSPDKRSSQTRVHKGQHIPV